MSALRSFANHSAESRHAKATLPSSTKLSRVGDAPVVWLARFGTPHASNPAQADHNKCRQQPTASAARPPGRIPRRLSAKNA